MATFMESSWNSERNFESILASTFREPSGRIISGPLLELFAAATAFCVARPPALVSATVRWPGWQAKWRACSAFAKLLFRSIPSHLMPCFPFTRNHIRVIAGRCSCVGGDVFRGVDSSVRPASSILKQCGVVLRRRLCLTKQNHDGGGLPSTSAAASSLMDADGTYV